MRRCVSCERGVWTSGAFSFMCARIRGVITFVKSWGGGRNGVCGVGMKKHPLYRVGTGVLVGYCYASARFARLVWREVVIENFSSVMIASPLISAAMGVP